MIEVYCPNCEEFVNLETDNLRPLEMEGDVRIVRGPCPKCKEIAEVKLVLHWQGL